MASSQNPQLLTPELSQMGDQTGGNTPESWAHHSTTWTPIDGTEALATNPSRKRSRDESAFLADGESSYFSYPLSQQISTPAPIPEEEPIYGEGMVLLNPKTGRPLAAESQTGTWWEEKTAIEENRKQFEEGIAAERAELQARPTLPTGRKSIRMSQSSIRANLEPVLTSCAPASPPKSSTEPTEIDEATIALGIGWIKMASEDPDLQAAARGWTKYIENHYRHINGAEILLKSRSLNAYLISCQEGFYLFSDDLLEGKLVAKTWLECLNNLRAVPMIFQGDEVLRAERTPGPESFPESMIPMGNISNGANHDQFSTGPKPVLINGSASMDLD